VSYCLCLYAPIEKDSLSDVLHKPLRSAWAFDDWDKLKVIFMNEDLVTADRTAPRSTAVYLHNLRASRSRHHGWYCHYDTDTKYISLVVTHWTGAWPAQLMGFNILRQAFQSAGNGDSGYVLAHDFGTASDRSLGAIMMHDGESQAVGPDAPIVQKIVSHARPLAQRIIAQCDTDPGDLIDEYDTLVLRPAWA